MKISKTIKKLNDRLNLAVKSIATQAKEEFNGLHDVTHTIQFDLFPGSLLVTFMFETHDDLDKAISSQKRYQKRLQTLLLKQGVRLKEPKHNLTFTVLEKSAL
ncbi:hypothetical protein NBRC116188_15740 [Oceaniserpentilla sp. 4NH20-0058]|uniref:hypothetical protein n=1 Tax=Oceaniserpentilla sp. 4NH20-0058 TaxID=3127660 RepID=UPI00310BAE4F